MEIVKGIHRLTNGVSNFYLIEDGGRLVLVDAGIPPDWGRLVRMVSSLGRNLANLEAILITHAHSDHTGFAERARVEARSSVWIHEADAAVAKGAPQGPAEGRLRRYLFRAEAWRTMFRLVRGAKIVPIHAVSAFPDHDAIPVPGHPRAVHVPGHTPGSACVFFEQRRILLTGDCLVMKNPFTGRTGPQIMADAANRDSSQALRSLDALEGLTADLILPGHGETWTAGAAKAVALARAAGRS